MVALRTPEMSPMIKIILDNFPDGGKVEWPEDCEAMAKVDNKR